MKKTLLSLTLCLLTFVLFGTLNAQAQQIYQLPNGDFEGNFYLEASAAASIVPHGFNSFYSATGTWATSGQAQRTWASDDVRPGSTGVTSVRLKSNVVLLVRANGNLTTGRINAGSMTANSADNYNYTDYVPNTSTTPNNPPKFIQEITGTPDSLRFWVKYLPGRGQSNNPPTAPTVVNTTDQGRIRVYIHGTDECRDAPQYPSGKVETDYYYGKATKNFFKENGGWQCYTVPFEYTGNNIQKNANGNYYLLISMTTNATPGGGSGNDDYVWFDDIEFIYHGYLSDLKVNGVTIPGFEKKLLTYGGPKLTGAAPYAFPYQPSDFTYTKETDSTRSVTITNVLGPDGDADGGYTSILTIAEDNVSETEYRIYYYAYRSDDNTIDSLSYSMDNGANSILVPGFTPSTLNYSITLTDPEEVRIPSLTDIVLADTTATIYRLTQPTGVNSVGTIVVRAQNLSLRTYNVTFSKVVSTNSKLNWIRIGGTNIADFDADVLEYEYETTTCLTAIPAVTYEKSSAWANVSYTPATLTNRTATITVTAEDGTQRTYTINFVLRNNNATVTTFRYGTSSTNQITTQEGVFVYVSAYSFTSAPSALTPTTLGCAGATYTREPASNVFYPDTNYYHITAQDGITTETYKVVIKNTNCYLATGANNAFRFNYNGLVDQNTAINLSSTSGNNNLNPFTTAVVTLPVGPNVPAELVVRGFAAAANAAPPTCQIIQPTSRTDTAVVIVTANDGVTQKIYRVPFRPTLSTDASLSNITWNGNSIVGFTPANTNYMVALDASVTQVPEIIGTPNFQWLPEGNIVVTPAEDLFGITTIVVTAENGTTTRTYYVEFTVQGPDNAYLSALRYNNIAVPNFRPTVLTYSVDIPYTSAPPVLSGTAMNPGAHVIFGQPTTLPYVGKVLVISENMAGMKIYTINFNRVRNTDPALADIQINGVSLQDFDPQEFNYDVELPYTELDAPVVTATPAYEYAQVDISEINTTTGTVTINVTAEDNAYTAVYTINFTRELSPVVAIETIVYEYDNETYTYEVTGEETEITIILPVETVGMPFISEITLADFRADFEIDEQPATTNDLTGTIIVTAEDLTEETYSIIFERTLSGSTLLTGISYALGSTNYAIDFDPEVLTYYVMLPFNTSQIPNVTATAAWQNTEVLPQNPSNPFGQGTILVTSENGQNTKTYTIVFQRRGSSNLLALSYNLDGVSIPVPGFDPSTLTYNVPLAIGTTAVPVLQYVSEDNRCAVDTVQQTTPNGTSQLTLTTWNGDDSKTYTVNFTVTLSQAALLADLLVNGETVPNFDENTLHYTIPEYPFGTVEMPVVTAVAKYPDATIEDIIQIEEYPGVVNIIVTAGNTAITRTYTVSFSVELKNNTYLSEILIDGEPIGGFDKDVYFYTWMLSHGTTEYPTVTATPEDSTSTVTTEIDGDTVKIIVTALSGDVAIYRVLFIVEKNNNAYLSNIFIDWKSLEGFAGYIPNYNYTLPSNYVGLPFVSVELADPNASYVKIWTETLPLQLIIIVTAENGETEFTYTITFDKLSIGSFDKDVEIQVYPNPSPDNIHFVINEMIQTGHLEIYSIDGKKAAHYSLQGGTNTVQIAHLPKGTYLYKISTDQAVIGVGKFVKN